jgi:lysosomal alpha-glucosidase
LIYANPISGHLFKGKVWNKGSTVWPDFTHPKAEQYWTQMMANYHQQVKRKVLN